MMKSTKFCILFIDNNSIFQRRVMSLLKDDYECHIATSGEEGLSLYLELLDRKPLVICDYNLQDISGADLCQAIKKRNNQAYVMMLFALDDEASRILCMRSQADHCLDKQIDDQELRLVIRNVCNTLLAQSRPKLRQREKEMLSDFSKVSLEDQARDFIKSYYEVNKGVVVDHCCTSIVMAEKVKMTHRTFQREIKKQSGYSFKQLHLLVRLEQAKLLLANGYNVSSAADALGFSSQSHLSRAFKNQFGLTPSEYCNIIT